MSEYGAEKIAVCSPPERQNYAKAWKAYHESVRPNLREMENQIICPKDNSISQAVMCLDLLYPKEANEGV